MERQRANAYFNENQKKLIKNICSFILESNKTPEIIKAKETANRISKNTLYNPIELEKELATINDYMKLLTQSFEELQQELKTKDYNTQQES